MSGACTSASRNSNCEAPVAAITWARPRTAMASRSAAAARAAAAAAMSGLVLNTRTSMSFLQGRPARTHEETEPFLRHQAVVGLRHVNAVEGGETGAIGGPREQR